MAVTDRHSRQAVTHYETIREYPGYAHIRLRLETGRTHQIRVHMAYLGHPGGGRRGVWKTAARLQGQCLHAREIGFRHPRSGHICTLPVAARLFTAFLEQIAKELGGGRRGFSGNCPLLFSRNRIYCFHRVAKA